MNNSQRAILLVSCPDQKGLVAKLAGFIAEHGGNIINATHHTVHTSGLFLTRFEWDLEGFQLTKEEFNSKFNYVMKSIQPCWQLRFTDSIFNVAIMVSRQEHCLLDLLWRQKAGEIPAQIPLIISNHPDLESIAHQFGIDYYFFNITKENKLIQETKQWQLLQDYQIDLVVLAKYMQILSPEFVARFPQIINIHHSFLPAFPGANPYQRAYERGVKLIGATSHYVTAELDEGPIIEQDVLRVSHKDTVAELIRKGKDLEKIVLARAVQYHLENKVLIYDNRTVVFA
ncbi:MAG: formyltetrahydrofolate deformylase [Stigonema ocellatum SAG 48.90 = DSM 106950]|nr:formyltetrahydrofolate deformylase [Stigonema ocellatum SAG 48.90 = DSM 106950]